MSINDPDKMSTLETWFGPKLDTARVDHRICKKAAFMGTVKRNLKRETIRK